MFMILIGFYLITAIVKCNTKRFKDTSTNYASSTSKEDKTPVGVIYDADYSVFF